MPPSVLLPMHVYRVILPITKLEAWTVSLCSTPCMGMLQKTLHSAHKHSMSVILGIVLVEGCVCVEWRGEDLLK